MGLASLGTDTRASIRVPAALCGVIGYKPTYGLVSTRGVVTLSWSMDHAAPMARSCQDVALLLNELVGYDSLDPASVATTHVDYRGYLSGEVRGLRVGVPLHGLDGADPEVRVAFERALRELESRGVELHELDQPSSLDFELANAAGLIVSRCEARAFHDSLLGSDRPYTDDVREQMEEAAQVRAVDYLQAQRFRADFQQRMAGLFQTVDALAMPTSRVVAPPSTDVDQYFLVLSQNCIPWSFVGFPAVSLPCGLTKTTRLPVGLELVGPPFGDGILLTLGNALERGIGRLRPSEPSLL
jgi:aspartyl-tRNA(Asn)/glutamyl-tRNA(Gln) amidotransferase subunit A